MLVLALQFSRCDVTHAEHGPWAGSTQRRRWGMTPSKRKRRR